MRFFATAAFTLSKLTMLRIFVKSKLRLTRNVHLPFASRKAGWLASMPESMTAHTISLQLTRKSVRAASALTAGTDFFSAGVAIRFIET